MIPIYCPICSGLYSSDKEYIFTGHWCTCHRKYSSGWKCPRCNKTNSPLSKYCDCEPIILSKTISFNYENKINN